MKPNVATWAESTQRRLMIRLHAGTTSCWQTTHDNDPLSDRPIKTASIAAVSFQPFYSFSHDTDCIFAFSWRLFVPTWDGSAVYGLRFWYGFHTPL